MFETQNTALIHEAFSLELTPLPRCVMAGHVLRLLEGLDTELHYYLMGQLDPPSLAAFTLACRELWSLNTSPVIKTNVLSAVISTELTEGLWSWIL